MIGTSWVGLTTQTQGRPKRGGESDSQFAVPVNSWAGRFFHGLGDSQNVVLKIEFRAIVLSPISRYIRPIGR